VYEEFDKRRRNEKCKDRSKQVEESDLCLPQWDTSVMYVGVKENLTVKRGAWSNI
jgi:hypothetical protein